MADLPPNHDKGGDTGVRPGTPRWVKMFGIIALVVVLLFVISLLAGVRHGPGLHTPPSSVTADRTPPAVALVATHRP